jgi:hypothetical protein
VHWHRNPRNPELAGARLDLPLSLMRRATRNADRSSHDVQAHSHELRTRVVTIRGEIYFPPLFGDVNGGFLRDEQCRAKPVGFVFQRIIAMTGTVGIDRRLGRVHQKAVRQLMGDVGGLTFLGMGVVVDNKRLTAVKQYDRRESFLACCRSKSPESLKIGGRAS